MALTLRYMQIDDIKPVVEIDHLAFDLPWSEESYTYEIRESTHTYMVVLEQDAQQPHVTPWWRRLLGLNGKSAQRIAGYGGLWKIQEEAHISTIATHPSCRGRGWGEILLAAMIRRAIRLQSQYVMLEVRVSNTVAQNLYTKYGFETVRIVDQYYRNNNEDAYEMRLWLDEDTIPPFEERFAALQAKHGFTDTYTAFQSPRLRRLP